MSQCTRIYILIAAAFFCVGIIFFLIQSEIIIINTGLPASYTGIAVKKKNAHYYFYVKNTWATDMQELLWYDSDVRSLEGLIQSWLSYAHDEFGLPLLSLQSVLCSSDCIYISFQKNPFELFISVYEKLFFVESLLKTVRENGFNYRYIQLLVKHALIEDDHIDTASLWPINGFIN